MNLSEEVSKGLELFGDSATKQHFTDDSFRKLAQVAFDVLLKKKTEDESLTSDAFGGVDFYILKQAYAALVGLLLEGTKLDADPLLISGTLGERNVSASRTEALAELYGQHKAALRSLLAYTSFNHPHVVDVDWRIDYHIKSANLERIDQLVYHITLKTEVGNGETKDVTFSCSLEELQDLVYRLKDATRQYENHLHRLEKFVK